MPVMRRDLIHHGLLRAAHHFVKRPIAEVIVRRPGRRVLADAVIAAGKRVAHVGRLTVQGVVTAGSITDLLAAVVVRDDRGEWIELDDWQAELFPIAID